MAVDVLDGATIVPATLPLANVSAEAQEELLDDSWADDVGVGGSMVLRREQRTRGSASRSPPRSSAAEANRNETKERAGAPGMTRMSSPVQKEQSEDQVQAQGRQGYPRSGESNPSQKAQSEDRVIRCGKGQGSQKGLTRVSP